MTRIPSTYTLRYMPGHLNYPNDAAETLEHNSTPTNRFVKPQQQHRYREPGNQAIPARA